MTASLLPNGKQQFFDTNGDPLVDGTVAFYIPNTSTPKGTWQDAAQTIPNENPVTLDSLGSAVIYGSGQYRQVLKDAAGNLLWDQLTQDYLAQVSQAIGQNQTLTATGQTILSTAAVVYINPGSPGSGTYLLPAAPTPGAPIWVKCSKGDEDVNPQTISGNGHTIDGKASYSFNSPYQSAGFSYNGAEWSLL